MARRGQSTRKEAKMLEMGTSTAIWMFLRFQGEPGSQKRGGCRARRSCQARGEAKEIADGEQEERQTKADERSSWCYKKSQDSCPKEKNTVEDALWA